jgi:group I intron endonuclease
MEQVLKHNVPKDILYTPGHYLYVITNTFNNRVYVGITNHLNKRISDHRKGMVTGKDKRGGKSYIYSSGYKHGVDKFYFTYCKTYDTREDLAKAEVDLIAYYKSLNTPIYNLTAGGEGAVGIKRSPETLLKMSLAQKERYRKERKLGIRKPRKPHTEETKAKIRAGLAKRRAQQIKPKLNLN